MPNNPPRVRDVDWLINTFSDTPQEENPKIDIDLTEVDSYAQRPVGIEVEKDIWDHRKDLSAKLRKMGFEFDPDQWVSVQSVDQSHAGTEAALLRAMNVELVGEIVELPDKEMFGMRSDARLVRFVNATDFIALKS